VLVTAGYANPAPLARLYEFVDAANVDIKAYSDDFYRRVCDATLKPVLDGLVLARVLHRAGADVEAFVAPPADRLSPLTRLMYERLTDAGGRVRFVDGGIEPLTERLNGAELIVDALFGTGMNRPLGGIYLDLVEAVNASGASVVSLDLPSGLPSDTGDPFGEAVRADVTLAMEFLKPAHLLHKVHFLIQIHPVGGNLNLQCVFVT
jgi:hydroxyethylthiazole kinase-like uncharacterized protein yjeF